MFTLLSINQFASIPGNIQKLQTEKNNIRQQLFALVHTYKSYKNRKGTPRIS